MKYPYDWTSLPFFEFASSCSNIAEDETLTAPEVRTTAVRGTTGILGSRWAQVQ